MPDGVLAAAQSVAQVEHPARPLALLGEFDRGLGGFDAPVEVGLRRDAASAGPRARRAAASPTRAGSEKGPRRPRFVVADPACELRLAHRLVAIEVELLLAQHRRHRARPAAGRAACLRPTRSARVPRRASAPPTTAATRAVRARRRRTPAPPRHGAPHAARCACGRVPARRLPRPSAPSSAASACGRRPPGTPGSRRPRPSSCLRR